MQSTCRKCTCIYYGKLLLSLAHFMLSASVSNYLVVASALRSVKRLKKIQQDRILDGDPMIRTHQIHKLGAPG